MNYHIECKSSYTSDPGDVLLVTPELRDWLASLPDGAHLQAITREHGSQRDPLTVTVGLLATWSEIR